METLLEVCTEANVVSSDIWCRGSKKKKERKEQFVCYAGNITPRTSHNLSRYPQRQNADRQDSVARVKPV